MNLTDISVKKISPPLLAVPLAAGTGAMAWALARAPADPRLIAALMLFIAATAGFFFCCHSARGGGRRNFSGTRPTANGSRRRWICKTPARSSTPR